MSAATAWRASLEAWAIPEEILAPAPTSPWIHPPVLFELPERIEDSPSHARAREALGPEGSLLDVGCGGGIAAYGVGDALRYAVGVDHQAPMLEMFARNGAARGVRVDTIEGFWPDVAPRTPRCEVACAHHVVYNVGDIVPFLTALNDHATRRVVLELPRRHPLANLSSAWQHFWGLARPSGPTPEDLLAVLAEMGIDATLDEWSGPMRVETDLDQAAHFTTIRLCLDPSREGEVRDFLAKEPTATTRELATIWWDVVSHQVE